MPDVLIELDANDDVVCNPPQLGADYNDDITFKSAFKFALHFGPHSPFDKFKEKNNAQNEITAKVKHDPSRAGAKVFKYTVAIWDENAQEVKITDPEIIIPPLGI